MALINKGLSTRLLTRISTMALVACSVGLIPGIVRASPTTLNSVSDPPPTSKYACTEMETVWMQAHCYNFSQETDHDAFYQFDWYKANDPRNKNPKTPDDWSGNTCTVATPYSSNDAIIE